MRFVSKFLSGVATSVALMAATPSVAGQFPVGFQLVNKGGVEVGSSAFVGFDTAARYWSSILTAAQPTTIRLNVGFGSLGPGILGSTGSSYTSKAIFNVLNRIDARQSGAFDASLVFPTLHDGQFAPGSAVDVFTPGYTGVDANGDPFGIDNSTAVYDTDGSYNNTFIGLTTANAKALGYTFNPGAADGSVTFSSDFGFDFDPRDGIGSGLTDFLAVAIHEIGHALGFVSGVDDYDVLGTGGPAAGVDCGGFACQDYPANDDWFGKTLDLFRYSEPGTLDWTTGTPSYFSADGGLTAYNNGYFSTGAYTGDGWQASHWKAPINAAGFFSCRLPKRGILNPYICSGQNGIVTGLDLAAYDAIGYNINLANYQGYSQSTAQIYRAIGSVPEPSTWALMILGFGLVGFSMRRRNTKTKVSFAM